MQKGRQILSSQAFHITLMRLAHQIIENYDSSEGIYIVGIQEDASYSQFHFPEPSTLNISLSDIIAPVADWQPHPPKETLKRPYNNVIRAYEKHLKAGVDVFRTAIYID